MAMDPEFREIRNFAVGVLALWLFVWAAVILGGIGIVAWAAIRLFGQ